MPHVLDSGALEALTPDESGILQEWTMKFAVITDPQTSHATLSIYASPSETDEPEVAIPINGCDVQISKQPDFEQCFTITTDKGLRIFLRASSVFERDAWLESIKRAQKITAPPAANISQRGIGQRNHALRRCCGYVYLFNEASQSWVERYFYLSSGYLNEFSSVFRAPIAQHDLSHNCAIRVRGSPQCIEVKLATGEILRFTGKTDEETVEWVSSIKGRAAEPPQPFTDFFRAAADASQFRNDEGSLTFILKPDGAGEIVAGYPSRFFLLGAHGDAAAVAPDFDVTFTPEDAPDNVLATPELIANPDGSVTVLVAYHKAGKYVLHIRYRARDIFGGPFKLVVRSAGPSAAHSLLTGAGIIYAPTGNKASKFTVRLRDRYLNLCEMVDPSKLQVRLYGPAVVSKVVQIEPSAFEIAYKSTSTAQLIEIEIAYDGVPIAGSPFRPSYEEPSFDSTIAEEVGDDYIEEGVERHTIVKTELDEDVREELRVVETTRQVAERAEAVSAFLSSKVRQDWAVNNVDIDKVFQKDEQLELLLASSSLRATGAEEEPEILRKLAVEVESGRGIKRVWEPEPLPPPWAPLTVVQAHVRHVRRDLQEAVQPLVDAVKTDINTSRRLEPASTWKRILLDWEGAEHISIEKLKTFKLAIMSSPLQHRDLIAAMCETVIIAEDDFNARKQIAGVHGEITFDAEDENVDVKSKASEIDPKVELKARLQPKSAKEELRKRVQALALGRDLRGPVEPVVLSAERSVRDKPLGETTKRILHSDDEDEASDEEVRSDTDGDNHIRGYLDDHKVEEKESKDNAIPRNYHEYRVGDRVIIDGAKRGTVRHVGITKFAAGLWIGVELDEKLGRNAGSVDGVKYFTCAPLHGLFVRMDRVQPLLEGENTNDKREEYLGPRLGPGSLPHIEPNHLVETLRTRIGEGGGVSRLDFIAALQSMDREIPRDAAEALFDVFDVDGGGTLEATEFIPGCLVLCGGARDDKIRMAFDLLDDDRSGTLDPEELMRYARAVFRVVNHANPDVFEQNGTDPETLAQASVQSAFEFCDRNSDGRLSFEEFRAWMLTMSSDGTDEAPPPPPSNPPPVSRSAIPIASFSQPRVQPAAAQAQPTISRDMATTPVKSTAISTRTPSRTPAQAQAEWSEVERWVLEESGIVIPFEQRSTLEHLRNNGITTLVRVARLTAADINHFNLSFDLRLRLVTQVRALAKKLVFEAADRKINLSPLAAS